MDRRTTPRILWGAAAATALCAAPLLFLNVGHVTSRGQNEELGLGLLALAAALSVGGALVRGLRSRAAQVGLALGLALPLVVGGFVVLVMMHAPSYPYTVIEWRRTPDQANATVAPASILPPSARDAILKAAVGDTGCAYFDSESQWRAFERSYVAGGGDPVFRTDPVVLSIEGRTFEFGRGPGAATCPIP